MARTGFGPRSKKQSDREIYRDQISFAKGMISGPPASKLPDDAIARIYNGICYPQWAQGRYAAELYTEIDLPALAGRTRLTGTQVGTTLTSPDAEFTEDDVTNIWVWNDDINNEIVEYLSPSQVRLRDSASKSGSPCWMHGPLNGRGFHQGKKKLVIQLRDDLYVANDLKISGWTKLLCVSRDRPSNSESAFDESEDCLVVFNSSGVFKIWFGGSSPYYYKMNARIPEHKIESNALTNDLTFGRRYIYTALRIDGDQNIRNRAQGNLIEQESGPCEMDENLKDYGENWTEHLIGNNTKKHGELLGASVATASMDATNVFGPITDGTFKISMNGREYNTFTDFTGVRTMEEVVAKVQTTLKQFWLDCTCELVSDQVKITSGLVADTTIDSVSAGVGGTDISGAGYLNIAAGTIDNNAIFAEPTTIEGLYCPTVSFGSESPEYHFTHYGVYGTGDIGKYGIDPVTGVGNDPERYVWLADVRIGFAVYARRNRSGQVSAEIGAFELADVGSVIEWENGDRDTITRYIDAATVEVDGAYYDAASGLRAAAVGNGRVMRAYQSGSTVYVTHGGAFVAGDERKTVYWSDGSRSYVKTVESAQRITVYDSATRPIQGITIDPTYRNFHDSNDDDVIRARTKGFTLKNRTWEPLPNGNTGAVVPGWMFVAMRGENVYSYSSVPPGARYLLGYYNPGFQFDDTIKGGIQAISEFPNRVVFYCSNCVYGGPSNTSEQIKIPGTGEFLNVFSGVQLLVRSIGIKDWGSIVDLDIGRQGMLCSDSSWRMFNGFEFSENLAVDQSSKLEAVMDDLRSWSAATAAAYKDGEILLWGLD